MWNAVHRSTKAAFLLDVTQSKFQTELDSLLSMQSMSYCVPRIDIADLSALIGRLKRRNAAGIDGIVNLSANM